MTAGFAESGPMGPDSERAAHEPDQTGPLPPRIDRPGPPVPAQHGPPTGPPNGPPTGSWQSAPMGYPTSGLPAVPPMSVSPPPTGVPRRSPVLAILVGVLAVLVVVQGVFLVSLSQRLDSTNRKLDAAGAANDKRLSALDGRAHTLEQQAAKELDSSAVAAAILPSVFRIEVDEGTATAFAISKPAGGGTDLLTNFHVVGGMWTRGQRTVAVVHDSQRFAIRIVQVDEDNDLALLHAEQNFPVIAATPAAVTPGTPIVLIGAPLGLSQSVTAGVVSAIRNDIPGDSGKTFIQFDAAINPGNSGGPVVNAQKQVVGVARAKVNAEGIGLAIPISVACQSFSGIC